MRWWSDFMSARRRCPAPATGSAATPARKIWRCRVCLKEGILVRLEETAISEPAGEIWSGAEVRVPIGTHNGSVNALVNIRLAPGGGLASYRCDNCEQVYYVAAGRGVAGSAENRSNLREGHFVFVPKGTPHWLRNEDSATTLEIFNVLTGAGSLEEAGFVGAD